MKKFICFLIGHDDPAIWLGDTLDNNYKRWLEDERDCRRCNKKLTHKDK